MVLKVVSIIVHISGCYRPAQTLYTRRTRNLSRYPARTLCTTHTICVAARPGTFAPNPCYLDYRPARTLYARQTHTHTILVGTRPRHFYTRHKQFGGRLALTLYLTTMKFGLPPGPNTFYTRHTQYGFTLDTHTLWVVS